MILRFLKFWAWKWQTIFEALELITALGLIFLTLFNSIWEDYKNNNVTYFLTAVLGSALLIFKFVSKVFERREKDAMISDQKRITTELKQRSEETAKRIVSEVLEHLRADIFSGEQGTDKFRHRATLFVAKEGKWLEIFARAGVLPNSQTCWRIDDNHPANCRGIAGQIWYESTFKTLEAPDDWPDNGDIAKKNRYCESLKITLEEAEGLNVKSNLFFGTIVLVRGKKWGVLLLDSTQRYGKTWTNSVWGKKRIIFTKYAALIGKVIEECS